MKKYFITALLTFFSAGIFAADQPYFNFDYGVFKGDGENSILEIYYSVNQKALTYDRSGENFEGAAKIDVEIADGVSGEIKSRNSYKSPSIVSDTTKSKLDQKLIGQINFTLANGSYKLRLTGSDFNDTLNKDQHEFDIMINNVGSGSVNVSDVELATSIEKAKNDQSIFYKNTLDVIPNPSALFGMNLNELYYYFEIYGLTSENISDDFEIRYEVLNLNSEKVITYSKKAKRNSESRADYGKIKIDSLKRGSYLLRVSVIDSSRNLTSSSEKKFYIFSTAGEQQITGDDNEYLRSEYVLMDDKQVDDEFRKMTYLFNEEQTNKYNALNNLDDKRKFLFNYWKARDPNPQTQVLENKIDYMKRVDLADKEFEESFKEGWKTDRGRIYLIYGKPDDIERFPFQAGVKAYEIWKYYAVEGGGECVFIELQPNTDVYWLVHSTFRNELKNEQWMTQLNPR